MIWDLHPCWHDLGENKRKRWSKPLGLEKCRRILKQKNRGEERGEGRGKTQRDKRAQNIEGAESDALVAEGY